jgi:hypothetical protein
MGVSIDAIELPISDLQNDIRSPDKIRVVAKARPYLRVLLFKDKACSLRCLVLPEFWDVLSGSISSVAVTASARVSFHRFSDYW